MLRNRTFKRKLKNYPILYQSNTSYLFTSNSLGRKWHGVTTPSLSSFDISLDGKYIIVSNNVENNYIRSIITLSSDYGKTLENIEARFGTTPPTGNVKIAMSKTGQYIFVVSYSRQLWYSNDFGVSFIKYPSFVRYFNECRAIEGKFVIIEPEEGSLYSYDFTDPNNIKYAFTSRDSDFSYSNMYFSDDMKYVYRLKSSKIYRSDDLGETYTAVSSLESYYNHISISSDGKYIYAIESNCRNNTYSSDYGVTWNIVNTGDYCYASVSSDGMYHIRQCDGKLYISEDYGNSFKEILNEPNLIGNNAAMKFKN